MDFEAILSAIGSVGFAMAICVAILVFLSKMITRMLDDAKDTKERLFTLQHETTEAIQNNTKIMTEMTSYLKGREHNE